MGWDGTPRLAAEGEVVPGRAGTRPRQADAWVCGTQAVWFPRALLNVTVHTAGQLGCFLSGGCFIGVSLRFFFSFRWQL